MTQPLDLSPSLRLRCLGHLQDGLAGNGGLGRAWPIDSSCKRQKIQRWLRTVISYIKLESLKLIYAQLGQFALATSAMMLYLTLE
jgi:hypothetical protein